MRRKQKKFKEYHAVILKTHFEGTRVGHYGQTKVEIDKKMALSEALNGILNELT